MKGHEYGYRKPDTLKPQAGPAQLPPDNVLLSSEEFVTRPEEQEVGPEEHCVGPEEYIFCTEEHAIVGHLPPLVFRSPVII